MAISGESAEFFTAGVNGKNTAGGTAIEGRTSPIPTQAQFSVAGVVGINEGAGCGVIGINNGNTDSPEAVGVKGSGKIGVLGNSIHPEGAGVRGEGLFCPGVSGESPNGTGVVGKSLSGVGVWGVSDTYEGMHAETKSLATAAIAAYNLNPDGTGAAIFAKKEGAQGHAGFFDGNVFVSNTLTVGVDIVLANGDCAEDFDIAGLEKVEPGTVMVIDSEGSLQPSDRAYDKRVAGVISGAGDFKPGIVLDKQESSRNRMPIALLGKVYCKVDANYGAIEVGDLLTTSPTLGHAMRVSDPLKAFGAVIGKALRPLEDGQGLIPILIALQ